MTQILPPKKSSHSPAPSTDAAAQLAQVWRETDLGDEWQDAGLPERVRYLVGARGLKVPPQWEWIIPTQNLNMLPMGFNSKITNVYQLKIAAH